MKKGFIFWRHKKFTTKKSYHPVIFWEHKDNEEFVGFMITTTKNKKYNEKNIPLNKDEYFAEKKVDFSNTSIVRAVLLKPVDWLVDYDEIGQLSETGIQYVEAMTKGLPQERWDEYNQK